VPYMEKPPLLYWLTALSFAGFGESEWSARIVPALSCLACVGLLVWFGKALGRAQAGRLAALMFVSGVGVAAMAHVLMFDMLLTALLGAALMHAYRYFHEGQVRFVRWSYAFLALAVLAKGWVALILFGLVIFGLNVGMAGSMRRFFFLCGSWFEPWALLIFCAVALPWHVAASLTEPIFAWFYFINEHMLRFLGKREPHDYYAGAWWYYLPRMMIYLFPWSFLLPCLWATPSRMEQQKALHCFLWMAWAVPLLFFSLSSAKANYYLVTVMPFAALHLAIAWENRGRMTGRIMAIPGVCIGVLAVMACTALTLRPEEATTWIVWGLSQKQFVGLWGGGVAGLAFAAAAIAWRKPDIGILAYLALPIWISFGLFSVLQVMEPSVSTRQTAQYLQRELPGRTVYLYRNFEEQSSLPFYLKQPVHVIESRSNDLWWGDRLRPNNNLLISAQQFGHAMQSQQVAVVVLDRQLQAFQETDFFNRFTGRKPLGKSTIFYN